MHHVHTQINREENPSLILTPKNKRIDAKPRARRYSHNTSTCAEITAVYNIRLHASRISESYSTVR
jgi:hypothetical protein